MKQFVILFLFAVIFFIPYSTPAQEVDTFRQEGIASWYGEEFDGRPTASGEIYDSSLLTAAHPTLPFGTNLVVTNLHNKKKVFVKVNDRGPFVPARVIDVSKAAAKQLDMIVTGTAPVLIESVEKVVSVSIKEPAQIKDVVSLKDLSETLNTAKEESLAPIISTQEFPVNVPENTYSLIPAAAETEYHIKVIPETNIILDKVYCLQVGSYKTAANAVETFEKLKKVELNPSYERYTACDTEYFRVIVAGIRGSDVQSMIVKIGSAGFTEALIREER